jgi:tetratricopeptide (TPR) repeat protein
MKAKLIIAGLLLACAAAGAYWYARPVTKLSETDNILVADFVNPTGDSDFDGTLQEALRVSLSQSPFLNLISEEKVAEALRSLGQPADSRLTPDLARAACSRLGATVYVAGSIAKDGKDYTLKLEAFRCYTGESIAKAKGEASGKENIVHSLGTAASQLRSEFGEDPASLQKFNLPLERATTASLASLKAFNEGRRLAREKGAIESVPALKKALGLDSRFALAYSNLAVGYYNLNQNALASDSIRQAFEAADRQTLRDRLHITTLYYDLGTGDVNKAIESYKEWVRLYPRDDIAKGNLASEYFVIGDYDQAAAFAQQALRLDPDSAAWYENLSTAYIALLRLDDAQNILSQAFARKLDDASMHADLYALAFLRDDPAAMEREITWSAGKPGAEDTLLALEADTEAYAGHVKRARALSKRAVDSAQIEQLNEPAAIWQGIAALREAVYGNSDEARKGAERTLEIATGSRDAHILAALVFARVGDANRSQKLLDDLAAGHISNTVVQSAWLPTIRAQTELLGRNPAKSLELLEIVKPYERGQLIGNLSYSCMLPAYFRAEAYLSAKKGPQAFAEFQKLLDNRGIVGNCWSGALAILGQARAQELSGSKNAARSSYQRFFDLWKTADPDVPILKSARAEFAKLK